MLFTIPNGTCQGSSRLRNPILSCLTPPSVSAQAPLALVGSHFAASIVCIDDSMDGHPLAQWTTAVCCAAQRLGRPVMNSRHCGRWMRDAGFVDAVERHFYWPLNTWPRGKKEKLIGMLAQQNLLDGVEAMSMALLTRGLKWSRGQVEVLLAGVRNDLKNRALHPYIDV